MAWWFLSSCLLALSLQVSAEWNTKDYLRREHSLTKPYQGSGVSIPYWDFLGHTIVTPNYVRLTPDKQSRSGALWNTVPVFTRNWELQVQFKIHGEGKNLFGDGMAIWYTRDRMIGGPVFGNMDLFSGLAVIIDTYSNHNGAHNHQHPYISIMVNNGSLHYDHDMDGTHTQLAGCEVKLRNFVHDTHLTIIYKDDTISVLTDLEGRNAWTECATVQGVKLPTGYFYGASATTGDLSDNHDIVAIKMYDVDQLDSPKDESDRTQIIPSAETFEPPRPRVDDPKPSSVKSFFLMMLGAIALIVLVVLAIMYYQNRQEQSRKRLY